jgi:FAD:protein FMN transferase
MPGLEPTLHHASRPVMGTLCEVSVYDADARRASDAMMRALDEMSRVDRLLSNYQPDSELSVMNREAGKAPFHASEELFTFVVTSRAYFDATRGAFDPTVGPLVRAWGFLTRQPARPPPAAIAEARAKSGFDKVRLDPAAHTVFYTVAGLEFDPGGIGKGYAADRAVDVLRRAGVTSALVSAGGSTLNAVGHPPDRPGWRIAIKNPLDPARPYAYVDLRDGSLSTSGMSEAFVEDGSRRLAHIFDPRRGEPVEHMCQATVVAPTGTASDALSKPAFILARGDVERVFRGIANAHVLRVEADCGRASIVWTTPGSSRTFIGAIR